MRAAAGAASDAGADISYTTWQDWESERRPLGDAMRRAAMVLFGWPDDWPERAPDIPTTTPDHSEVEAAPLRLVQDLALEVESLTALVGEMGAEMERLRRELGRGGT